MYLRGKKKDNLIPIGMFPQDLYIEGIIKTNFTKKNGNKILSIITIFFIRLVTIESSLPH